MGDYKDYREGLQQGSGLKETNESRDFDGYINILLICSPTCFSLNLPVLVEIDR